MGGHLAGRTGDDGGKKVLGRRGVVTEGSNNEGGGRACGGIKACVGTRRRRRSRSVMGTRRRRGA